MTFSINKRTLKSMNKKTKNIIVWVLVIIFTFATAYYQRKTGPTYSKSGSVSVGNEEINYKLTRSHGGEDDAQISILVKDRSITGTYRYKKINSEEGYIEKKMRRDGDHLVITIPHQPPAGKIRYEAMLNAGNKQYLLTEEPVVIRFKGHVPLLVLIPHIVLMFLAMLLSTRTGVEAIMKGKNTYQYSLITLALLLVGGMILGPVIQKLAFGEFWAGWPLGQDLTDNKTLVAFIFWIIAVIRLRKNRNNRGWAIAASIILLAIYLIPHSMFGSELDYSTGEVGTGNN